jgi:hypothetical protein
MENLIKFEQRTATERKVLGTVAKIAGPGATINFTKNNFNHPTKRLHVVLSRPDGSSFGINCSPAVGSGVRNKEITMSQLAGFPIIEHVVSEDYANAGVVMCMIAMPDGQGLISAGEITEVAEYVPETFEPSDLVAF